MVRSRDAAGGYCPTYYCTIIMAPQSSNGGGWMEYKSFGRWPNLPAHHRSDQSKWDPRGPFTIGRLLFRSAILLEIAKEVVVGMPQLDHQQQRVGPRSMTPMELTLRAKHSGMRTTRCYFCGETRRLQKTDIARNWRRARSIWSSGGKVWLRVPSDPSVPLVYSM